MYKTATSFVKTIDEIKWAKENTNFFFVLNELDCLQSGTSFPWCYLLFSLFFVNNNQSTNRLKMFAQSTLLTIVFGRCFCCMWLDIHGFLGSNRFNFDGVQFVVSGSHFHQRNKSTFSLGNLFNINFYREIRRFVRFGLLALTKRHTNYSLNNYIFMFSTVFRLNFVKTFFFLSLFQSNFFYLTALSTVKLSNFNVRRGESVNRMNGSTKEIIFYCDGRREKMWTVVPTNGKEIEFCAIFVHQFEITIPIVPVHRKMHLWPIYCVVIMSLTCLTQLYA